MHQNFAERLGWVPKSENLRITMGRALNYAQERGHSEVTLEHFLLSLIDDQNAAAVFEACRIDLVNLRTDVTAYINNELRHLTALADGILEPSEGVKKVMAHASAAAEQSQRNHIDGSIVLAALIGEGESQAANILNSHGLTFEIVVSNLKIGAQASEAEQQNTDQSNESHTEQPNELPVPESNIVNENHQTTANTPDYSQRPEEEQTSLSEALADSIGSASHDFHHPAEQVRHRAAPQQAAPNQNEMPRDAGGAHYQSHPQLNTQVNTQEAAKSAPDFQSHDINGDSTVEDILASVREIIGVDDEIKTEPEPDNFQQHNRTQNTPYDGPAKDFNPQQRSQNIQNPYSSPPQKPDTGLVRDNNSPEITPAQNSEVGKQDTAFTQTNTQQAPNDFNPMQGMPPGQQDRLNVPPIPNEGYNQDKKLPPLAPNTFPAGQDQQQFRPPQATNAPENQRMQRDEKQGNFPPIGNPNDPTRVNRSAPPQDPRRMRKRKPRPEVTKGQLIENIPRSMQVDTPVEIEVRVARTDIQDVERGLIGNNPVARHEVLVTEAMSVQLVAPKGQFTVENRSPETQWIDNRLGVHGDNYATWRWRVTPTKSGQHPMQLTISARIVGENGVVAQSSLPEQIVQVNVQVNYIKICKMAAGWIALACLGGVLGKYSENILQMLGLA